MEEMRAAELEILKCVQLHYFPEELQSLTKFRVDVAHVKKNSSLRSLDPILVDCLFSFGGRLGLAPISFNSKHQIILPKSDHVSTLIIEHCYLVSGHSGRECVPSLLRKKFWIVKVSSAIRRVLSKCISCRCHQRPVCEQKMAHLPVDHLTPDQPTFISVGVDYFGPFQVKHGQSLVKRYRVIFMCLAICAEHIKVSHSLDTNSFLLAPRRFIVRRGQVKRSVQIMEPTFQVVRKSSVNPSMPGIKRKSTKTCCKEMSSPLILLMARTMEVFGSDVFVQLKRYSRRCFESRL